MRHIQHIKQNGVTVVEMVIVLTVIPILLVIFSVIFINSSIESLNSNAKTGLSIQATRALNFIEQSVRTSREFFTTAPSSYTDPFQPNGTTWNYRGSSSQSRVLILDQYATTSNSLSAGRLPVYKKGTPFDCSDSTRKPYNEKIHYLHIFFVKDKNLYRRTLTDRVSVICPNDTQAQKQSCPADRLYSSNCKTKVRDETIATGVESFIVEYYDEDGDAIATNAYSLPDVPRVSERVKITLKLADEKKKNINASFSQTMTKGNE